MTRTISLYESVLGEKIEDHRLEFERLFELEKEYLEEVKNDMHHSRLMTLIWMHTELYNILNHLIDKRYFNIERFTDGNINQ